MDYQTSVPGAYEAHVARTEDAMIDTRTAPHAALLLRVSLGVLFLGHGLQSRLAEAR